MRPIVRPLFVLETPNDLCRWQRTKWRIPTTSLSTVRYHRAAVKRATALFFRVSVDWEVACRSSPRRARELANDADLRIRPPADHVLATINGETATSSLRVGNDDRLPMAGALLRREYKGRTIQVRVLPKGFEFDGEIYRSLSAVARKVTGAHWNGYHFFGLPKLDKEAAV